MNTLNEATQLKELAGECRGPSAWAARYDGKGLAVLHRKLYELHARLDRLCDHVAEQEQANG